jgi:hypothetical protein
MAGVSECPFKLCNANVIMLVEQAVASDDEGTIQRVPQHQTGGHEDFGLCPASLMVVPLDTYSSEQLDEQAVALLRIVRDRKAAAAQNEPASGGDNGQPEHPSTPHPDPRKASNWFENSVRPPLRLLPADGSNTTGGQSVASIEEIKAALERAGQLAAEAKDAVFVAEGKAAEALQLVNFIRDTSVDPIGAPQLLEAIRLMLEAGTQLQLAIEANTTYRSTR